MTDASPPCEDRWSSSSSSQRCLRQRGAARRGRRRRLTNLSVCHPDQTTGGRTAALCYSNNKNLYESDDKTNARPGLRICIPTSVFYNSTHQYIPSPLTTLPTLSIHVHEILHFRDETKGFQSNESVASLEVVIVSGDILRIVNRQQVPACLEADDQLRQVLQMQVMLCKPTPRLPPQPSNNP
ncbi:hypothetical protein J6590_027176 [Homalodisca vitripennis]|nr:hypothetical protein J6590_027176 [Homalodisca vitripennis]